MDYNKLAEQLKAKYNEAILPVRNIGMTLEQYYKSKGQKFSADIFCKQFDCILQYSMLEIAVADGTITGVELAIVKGITKYCDLVEYINSNYNAKITWEDILKAGVPTVKKWLANQKPLLDKLAKEFVYGFAMVDASVTKEDILKELIEGWAGVLGLLSCADGDGSNSEREALRKCYVVEVVNKIEELVKKAENK